MIHLRGHGYAEAFVLVSAEEYRRLARRIAGTR
jgi:PHD/YefM family antitoxin component YafN of YafNO toxin-antitoxin module